MEMPLWRSACAAARDERQQLYDEMARLRAKYRTTISKLADDFIQEESDLRSRMKAFEDRSAILRLSVEPHESSSQPVLKRARDYEYDFAPVAPERLQPAPVTNDYVFAPVTPERLQPAPTRPPVFANWSEDEVEQPKSLPAEVPRMESRGQPDGAVADEKDSDMSAQERLDRRNTAWWLERKANEQARLEQMRKDDMEVAAYGEVRKENEHADMLANFNEWVMDVVVAALELRPGSTSAFATSCRCHHGASRTVRSPLKRTPT